MTQVSEQPSFIFNQVQIQSQTACRWSAVVPMFLLAFDVLLITPYQRACRQLNDTAIAKEELVQLRANVEHVDKAIGRLGLKADTMALCPYLLFTGR